MYKIGTEPYKPELNEKCTKCGKDLVRLYRHINPKHGKQKWVSLGWYCDRCKCAWMDEDAEEKIED